MWIPTNDSVYSNTAFKYFVCQYVPSLPLGSRNKLCHRTWNNMRKQYLIMFWAVLGLIACVPIGLLTQPSFNSYTGPEFIVSTSRTSFLLFFIGGTLITGIYALTAMWENGENFSQRNVVLMILTATCAALFLYPFVYDPLYYHLAARSVNAGVNHTFSISVHCSTPYRLYLMWFTPTPTDLSGFSLQQEWHICSLHSFLFLWP